MCYRFILLSAVFSIVSLSGCSYPDTHRKESAPAKPAASLDATTESLNVSKERSLLDASRAPVPLHLDEATLKELRSVLEEAQSDKAKLYTLYDTLSSTIPFDELLLDLEKQRENVIMLSPEDRAQITPGEYQGHVNRLKHEIKAGAALLNLIRNHGDCSPRESERTSARHVEQPLRDYIAAKARLAETLLGSFNRSRSVSVEHKQPVMTGTAVENAPSTDFGAAETEWPIPLPDEVNTLYEQEYLLRLRAHRARHSQLWANALGYLERVRGEVQGRKPSLNSVFANQDAELQKWYTTRKAHADLATRNAREQALGIHTRERDAFMTLLAEDRQLRKKARAKAMEEARQKGLVEEINPFDLLKDGQDKNDENTIKNMTN